MFACQICNQFLKNDIFPLEDESTRAQLNNNNILKENCLLLNPYFDEVEEHITFCGENPYPIDDSLKGTTTIEMFQLSNQLPFISDKTVINSRRDDYLKLKKVFIQKQQAQSEETKNEINDIIKALLKTYFQGKAQWSLMIKCALKDDFRY